MNYRSRKPQFTLALFLTCAVATMGCNSPQPVTKIENKPTQSPEIPQEVVTPKEQPPEVANDPVEKVVEKPESWTVKRIFGLSANGPVGIDLSINVSGKAIEEASDAAIERAIARIEKDLEKPWSWQKLLDHPLVRSGWLGNLATSSEQRDELLAKYDKNGDDQAEVDELKDFLAHGLTRDTSFQFTDAASARSSMSGSPWQQLDTNQDSFLDKTEITEIPKVLALLDQNHDRILTLAEIQEKTSMLAEQNASMSGTQKSGTAIFWDVNQKLHKFAQRLIDDYCADRQIPRDQWTGWSDAQWSEVDKDENGYLTPAELENLASLQPDLNLMIQFESKSQATTSLSAKVMSGSNLNWASSQSTAGQATGKLGVISVEVNDKYILADREKIRQQFEAAITTPQVASTLQTQLKLNDGAIELLDADEDEKLSDEEFQAAWEWLTLIRGKRIFARWMFAESAWFRMGDVDADGRLSEKEQNDFEDYVTSLDLDSDGGVSPSEFPLAVWQNPFVIRLEIVRTDDQQAVALPANSEMSTTAVGWFAASDSNSDNSVSKSEFLGTSEDFSQYDADNDGIISASEAYKNESPRVQ